MTIQTDRSISYFGLWAVLIALTAFGGSISAQSRQGGSRGVTVYADPNFSGQNVSFRNDMPNLGSAGWNDKISSIRIPSGETWEMCQDVDYRNHCQVLSGDVVDLRGMGWNDRISSLRRVDRVRQWGGTFDTRIGITVYADPNFKGQSASFGDDTPNVDRLNDKISSIRIPNGEAWEVCQDTDYRNQCQVLSDDVADLRSMGWNDRISSLRSVNSSRYRERQSEAVFQDNVEQSLLFYDRGGFTGASTIVTGRSSNVGWSARQGSVQLRGGGSWELCDSSGRCATITQDVAEVSRLGLNGRITSARIVETSQYRRDR